MLLSAPPTIEIDLRYLQAASNRYLKPGFDPLPLDGKNSVKLGSDLTYDLIVAKQGSQDPGVQQQADAYSMGLSKSSNFDPDAPPGDQWLLNNASGLTDFLNQQADLLGLPPAEEIASPDAPGGKRKGAFPPWAYAAIGAVVVAIFLGSRAIGRVEPAPPQ